MPDKSHDADLLRYRAPPRLKLVGIVALCVAGAIAVIGIGLRTYDSHKTAAWTNDQIVPSVQLLALKGPRAGGALTLPGDVEAFTAAPIYAQVAGYVQKWYVDIGAPVKAGALLAQIDPRSFQATLEQTRGQLAKDQAALAGAQRDLKRYQALLAANAESQQVVDDELAVVSTDQGIVQSDQANVATAQINLGYTRIIAPFDGVVTSRSVDVGSLVTVGTAASTTPLFTVTDQTKMRLYVHVPQSYSAILTPGLAAQFTVPEYPGRMFNAVLAASAGAVSTQNGTQLVQFVTDNKTGALKSGDYADVRLRLPAGKGAVRLPATALLFRDEGMMIATVDNSSHVHLRTVAISEDMGNTVEIDNGIAPTDRLIDNPPDSIQDGDLVRVMATKNR
jgi:RND family efflux transporter MFP subunit